MIDPVAFTIFGWPIRWYGILISIAFLLGVAIASRLAKKRGIDSEALWSILLIVIPAAIVGARLYYVLFHWSYYREVPGAIIATWQGGLAIHGGLLFGLAGLVLACRHYRENVWQIADVLVAPLALGQAIGRWGNFINREAYGTATDLPWAISIDGEMRHPTFLYESILDFAIFLLLLLFFPRAKKEGNVFLAYLVLYSAGRFFIEGLRTDSLMLGPLRAAQVMSVVLLLLGLALLFWRNRGGKKADEKNPPTKGRRKRRRA